jgi:hypothetical protein
MTRLILAALIALPAHAEMMAAPADRVTVLHDPQPGEAWYARMQVENKRGVYNVTKAYPTEHGPVTLRYRTTAPSTPGDPYSADEVCVMDLPEGVSADPICQDVMEEETGTVFLYVWLGG